MGINKYLEAKYVFGEAVLRSFNGNMFKITQIAVKRRTGFKEIYEVKKEFVKKGTVNKTKLDNNMVRAKSAIFELAICNTWDYFCTFTINGKKHDRKNLDMFQSKFGQWIRNYNKKYGCDIKYLVIPEKHKTEEWHEHGFISGIPKEHLRKFSLIEKLPLYIINKLKKGEQLYDWTAYREAFGFNDLELIENHEAAAKYCTKYITKNKNRSVSRLHEHYYYCSKGLIRSTIEKKGILSDQLKTPFFKNDHCKIYLFDKNEKLEDIKKLIKLTS